MIACEQDVDVDEEEEVEGDDAKAKEKEASLNSSSVVGLDSLKTMKFIGIIRVRQVLILLDNGATHNFISDQLVAEMQIPV